MMVMLACVVAFVGMTQVCYGVAPDSTDYCESQFNCEEIPHLRCEFTKAKPSKLCSSVAVETTPESRKVLLQWMNLHRMRVASGSLPNVFNGTVANMRQLTWDHKLEEFALVAGTQCASPGKFRSVIEYSCAGTKEFMEGTSAITYSVKNLQDLNNFIQDLKKIKIPAEVIDRFAYPNKTTSLIPSQKFDTEPSGPFFPKGYPSHTAVLWANAYKVGCSIVTCVCRIYGFTSPTTHVVCYFGTEPNIVGEQVFINQKPCSSCPTGTKCRPRSSYNNLCARKTDPRKASETEDIDFPPDIDDVNSNYRNELPSAKSARKLSASPSFRPRYIVVCIPLLTLKPIK